MLQTKTIMCIIYNEAQIKYVTTIAHNMGWENESNILFLYTWVDKYYLKADRDKLKMNSIKPKIDTKNHKQNKMYEVVNFHTQNPPKN